MRILEDERKPLPKEEQPFAARMVTPKGLQLRLMLTMPYAAQCAVGPGKQWDTPYPVESTAKHPVSWMSLSASVSQYAGPGIQLASEDVNRRRQITQALKTLESMALVRATPDLAASAPVCRSCARTGVAPSATALLGLHLVPATLMIPTLARSLRTQTD
ncbi:hypothetical protein ACFZDI_11255 [Streptomyces sp. NPDC007907]|uniref:hypothetical protein n=1 Tax=Streptomyces sp. NPDC007907 TaxID=3364789 RepID=UPI0036E0CE5A